MKETKVIKAQGKKLLDWFEIGLGGLALIAVIIVTIIQVIHFIGADWSQMDIFLEIMKVILQLAIGIELARMLFSYNLHTIIELAVFIVTRKMLLLDGDFVGLLLGVVALAILFSVRHFFINDDTLVKKKALF